MRKQFILQRLHKIKDELNQPGADIAALEQEARSLKTELEGIQSREAIFAGLEPAIHSPEKGEPKEFDQRNVAETPEYRSAWAKVMLGREKEMTEVERRAFTTADNSAGAVIPREIADKIYEKMAELSPILAKITRTQVPGNLRIPKEKANALASWHQELAEITPANDALEYVDLVGHELVKLVRASIATKTMSIAKFEAYIIESLTKKLALACEAAVLNGTGTGQPKGIKRITWNATNSLTYTKNGIPTYDNIMALNALLPSGYHSNACYIMNAKTFYTHVKTIKDNEGRPLFDTQSGKLENKDIVFSDQCEDKTILLGDLSYYHMNESADARIDMSTESSFAKAAIDYRGIMVVDGAPIMDEAYVKLSEAA